MPELPEVQTIVNDLNKNILNKKIERVEICLSKIVKGKSADFRKILEGNSFQNIIRRGKFIIIKLTHSDKHLLIHLRMTGQLIYINRNVIITGGHSLKNDQLGLPSKQTHLIVYFQDDSRLFYNDQRQFGYWQIVDSLGLEEVQCKLGIEPLSPDFNSKNFEKLLVGKRGNIKSFLLNQRYIAGLGNIYVDESLFQAGILPIRLINSLKKEEINKLHRAIKGILRIAIRYRGTTFNHYRDAQGQRGRFVNLLKVYQREGQKCLRCSQGVVKKIKVAGRGTRYCSFCQK